MSRIECRRAGMTEYPKNARQLLLVQGFSRAGWEGTKSRRSRGFTISGKGDSQWYEGTKTRRVPAYLEWPQCFFLLTLAKLKGPANGRVMGCKSSSFSQCWS